MAVTRISHLGPRRPLLEQLGHYERRPHAAAIRPRRRDLVWMATGAIALLVLTLTVLHFQRERDPTEEIALKARKIDLVERMRVALVSASEAEKSAVLAITDEDSQRFADEARASTGRLEELRHELDGMLTTAATQHEHDLFLEFSKAFADLRRVDDDVLSLAVRNTNLKAYGLAYGPAAAALSDMHDALARLVAAHAASPQRADVTALALGAEVAALRVQAMLPPHIAEERDDRMDEMEAAMGAGEEEVEKSVRGLRAIPEANASPDLDAATSSWDRFRGLKARILVLSRENTNVRSLTISLDRKRKAMLASEEILASLRQAIEDEPIAGVTYGRFPKPR